MAMTIRASASKAAVSRQVQTRQVRVNQAAKLAVAGVASVALAAAAVAPAEAANVISTVASATEGYPFVPPAWAPSVFVPLTGLVLPAVGMATLFVYIQKEAPAK